MNKAFEIWFGDSKVVDGQGKPLVVYHGTNSDFTVFRGGRGGVYQNARKTSSFMAGMDSADSAAVL